MNIQYSGCFHHMTNHAQFCKKSVDSKFPPVIVIIVIVIVIAIVIVIVSNSSLNKFYALSMPISILLGTAGGMSENHLTVSI